MLPYQWLDNSFLVRNIYVSVDLNFRCDCVFCLFVDFLYGDDFDDFFIAGGGWQCLVRKVLPIRSVRVVHHYCYYLLLLSSLWFFFVFLALAAETELRCYCNWNCSICSCEWYSFDCNYVWQFILKRVMNDKFQILSHFFHPLPKHNIYTRSVRTFSLT